MLLTAMHRLVDTGCRARLAELFRLKQGLSRYVYAHTIGVHDASAMPELTTQACQGIPATGPKSSVFRWWEIICYSELLRGNPSTSLDF